MVNELSNRDARNPELERAILANPYDREAYAVFADWLQERGDPRGELISLQLAGNDVAAKQLLAAQEAYFLGPLAKHQQVYDGNGNNSRSHLRNDEQEAEWQKVADQAFLWRNGYIYRCRLSHDHYSEEYVQGRDPFEGPLVDVLEQVLDHPSGRYIVEFAFQSNNDPNEDNLQDLIDLLGQRAPATTRKITFGDNCDQVSWHHTGNLGTLWAGVPGLQVLEIETGDFDVGEMIAPNLERAIFMTGGLAQDCARNIATATMPKIKHLEVFYGVPDYGGTCTIADAIRQLDRTDLPALEYLGLKNSTFQDAIAAAAVHSPLVKQLKVLDLSMGTMTDEGAAALAANKHAFAHLERLDLSYNYLSEAGIRMVAGLCRRVVTDVQQEAHSYGDRIYRYPQITE